MAYTSLIGTSLDPSKIFGVINNNPLGIPNTGTQTGYSGTATPLAPSLSSTPNTALNIAYGGSPTVTNVNGYTNNPNPLTAPGGVMSSLNSNPNVLNTSQGKTSPVSQGITTVAEAQAGAQYDTTHGAGSYAKLLESGVNPAQIAANATQGLNNPSSGIYNPSGSSTGLSTGFVPTVPTTLDTGASSSNLTYNDVLNSRQQLMQEYQAALSNYANTQTQSQLANLNAQYSGDTTAFGNSAGVLSQMKTGIQNQNALLQAQNYGTLLGANAQTAQLIPGQYQSITPGNTLVGIGNGTPTPVYGGLGQNSSGGGQQTLQTLAQVANTQGWNAAVSMLGAYANDPNTVNQLMQATQALNPNFNINQSNATGAAQATNTQSAGSLNTQIPAVNSVLGTLQQAQTQLSGLQNTGIPYLSAITTNLSSKLGSSSATTYEGALADARIQVGTALAAAGLVAPSDAQSAGNKYLPDGMTTQQLQSQITLIQNLLNQRLTALNSGGTSNTTSSQKGGAVNYNF